MFLFKILDVKEIELNGLVSLNIKQNFPKNIVFPFPDLYQNWITNIKTTIIFPDFELYNFAEAIIENKDFMTNDYWVFAGNGQGDRWLFDKNGYVFFYNHDYDESFDAMQINFLQSIQMAFLFKQLDEYRNENGDINANTIAQFTEVLNQIHPNLSENYPFIIE